ncbi:hypothetical protein KAT24_01180 [Candidatus Pacearchaeota archaeon]|nr:hypothetical protein [Candidatus Pacearchaeota archaeon]
MVSGHKIKTKIELNEFLERIREYEKKDIEPTKHTFFRLNEKQREILNEGKIKEILTNEIPILVGIQYNNLWAVFYKYENDFIRIIIDIQLNKIYIVSFYLIDKTQIPRI